MTLTMFFLSFIQVQTPLMASRILLNMVLIVVFSIVKCRSCDAYSVKERELSLPRIVRLECQPYLWMPLKKKRITSSSILRGI